MTAKFLLALLLLVSTEETVNNQLARDIYKELVEINTTESAGNTTMAAQAMGQRLKDAGLPEADIHVLGPNPRRGNLVARYRGSGEHKPLLLLAHLDVVEASRGDWSIDPFKFLEREGYFWGRGTTDDKAMAAVWVATFIRFKQEHYLPDRDLILALTADEETGNANGVRWLLADHRDLIDAEYAFNEGGENEMMDGHYLLNAVQSSEKVYESFRLEVHSAGGHSSRPVRDNAIYRLADALARLSKFQFPAHVNEVTMSYYGRMASIYSCQTAADMRAVSRNPPDRAPAMLLSKSPQHIALLRTTCVATRLEAGNADNALPQLARAV